MPTKSTKHQLSAADMRQLQADKAAKKKAEAEKAAAEAKRAQAKAEATSRVAQALEHQQAGTADSTHPRCTQTSAT